MLYTIIAIKLCTDGLISQRAILYKIVRPKPFVEFSECSLTNPLSCSGLKLVVKLVYAKNTEIYVEVLSIAICYEFMVRWCRTCAYSSFIATFVYFNTQTYIKFFLNDLLNLMSQYLPKLSNAWRTKLLNIILSILT